MTEHLSISSEMIWQISGQQWWLKPWLVYRSRGRLVMRQVVDQADPRAIGIVAVVILGLVILWQILGYGLLIGSGLLVVTTIIWARALKQQRRYFLQILRETDRHNKLVNALTVLDQLGDCGHTISTTDREAVIQALALSQSNLLRAFKTERILRENPDFEPQTFCLDFSALQTNTLDNLTSEYGQLFQEAMEVSAAVQTDLSNLRPPDL